MKGNTQWKKRGNVKGNKRPNVMITENARQMHRCLKKRGYYIPFPLCAALHLVTKCCRGQGASDFGSVVGHSFLLEFHPLPASPPEVQVKRYNFYAIKKRLDTVTRKPGLR